MTRFARAKGSKSSNERAPEDSTPWEVMKEQLLQTKRDNEQSKKREEAENKRLENYQNFLKEQKVQKKNSSWCDFPETHMIGKEQPPKKKKKNNSANSELNQNGDVTQSDNINDEKLNSTSQMKKKKKKVKKTNSEQTTEVKDTVESEQDQTNQVSKTHQANPKKKKKNKKPKQLSDESQSTGQSVSEQTEPLQEGNDTNSNKQHSNINKKQQKKKKPAKFVDGKPVRRKEINDRSFQLIISGKEVELIRFDGFPIMKKDAERLEELKKNMIKKGIPKSEVQRTMKLERRRAEKALARMKREVCYNCRKGGHNLSDCPDLKSKIPGVDAPEGVCFKCGSTEHKQFECKVQKDKEFKFATCFICKEPGHIARQCPDNPKGLYPNGGSCKLCGDVTHLRKDCPTVQDKREEASIKLQTLDSNVEDIGIKMKSNSVGDTVKKPKKIKF